MSNTFGKIFTFTSFGESHGRAVGGIVDGCPPLVEIDEAFIQHELNRRRPGQSDITTPRREDDRVEFLSGIFEGRTTGTPSPSSFGTATSAAAITTICGRYTAPRTPTSPTSRNTASATTGAEDAVPPARQQPAWWPVPSPSWPCARRVSTSWPTPRKWDTSP